METRWVSTNVSSRWQRAYHYPIGLRGVRHYPIGFKPRNRISCGFFERGKRMTNRIVKIFTLLVILLLVGCNSQPDETTYSQNDATHLQDEIPHFQDEIIASLEIEHHLLIEELERNNQRIAELEEELYRVKTANQNGLLVGFLNNLESVSDFLGGNELNIDIDDITFDGDFVTVNSTIDHNGLQLIFHHRVLNDESRWVLLEYTLGPISGPGFLDGGRLVWQWQQGDLFDESFTVRFHRYDELWPEPTGNYIDEVITPNGWQQQVKNHTLDHKGIRIINLWYEETRLVVDITPMCAIPFDHGSFGGTVRTRSFVDTLKTLPNVTEVEILVGGQRGVSGSHFSFAGAFRVD